MQDLKSRCEKLHDELQALLLPKVAGPQLLEAFAREMRLEGMRDFVKSQEDLSLCADCMKDNHAVFKKGEAVALAATVREDG